MSSGSGSPDLSKSHRFKCFHEAHEAVAGRVPIDGIGLHNLGALFLGVVYRGADQSSRHTPGSKSSMHEEADDGPYVPWLIIGSAKLSVAVERCYRAPRDGLSLDITQYADGNTL